MYVLNTIIDIIDFVELLLIKFISYAVVDCGRLSDPTNGGVSFRTTTFNSRAAYSCNNGFLLVGQTTRVCQSTGEWSGKAPVCKSEQNYVELCIRPKRYYRHYRFY